MLAVLHMYISVNKVFLVSIVCVFSLIDYIRTIYN